MRNLLEKKDGKLNKKIKINIMTKELFEMLRLSAEADKAKALLSLKLLS